MKSLDWIGTIRSS